MKTRQGRDIVSVAAMAALGTLVVSSDAAAGDAGHPPLVSGETYAITVKPGALACRSLDDYLALIQLLADRQASSAFVNDVLLKGGQCRMWASGMEIRVDDQSTASAPRGGQSTLFICARPVGETRCHWVTHWTLR